MVDIVLVKEPGMMRDGIELIIKEHFPYALIESYSLYEVHAHKHRINKPDLIIVEWKGNQNNILQLVNYYLNRNVKVALWTSEIEKDMIHRLLRLDVHGYLYDEMSPSEFVASIRCMFDSHIYMHPKFLKKLLCV